MSGYTPIGKRTSKREIKALPDRCPKGQAMLSEWIKAMNESTMITWEHVFSAGYKPYMKHALKCPSCRAHLKVISRS